MLWLVLRSLLAGVAGAVVLPAVVFALVMIWGRAGDARCGTPGDSGGCEMGAGVVALAAVMPGFAIAFAVVMIAGLVRRKGWRSLRRQQEPR